MAEQLRDVQRDVRRLRSDARAVARRRRRPQASAFQIGVKLARYAVRRVGRRVSTRVAQARTTVEEHPLIVSAAAAVLGLAAGALVRRRA